MRELLVTGASGFVGRHLLPLAAQSYSVTAIGQGQRPDWLWPDIAWIRADLAVAEQVKTIPQNPFGVIHLAAEAMPGAYRDAAVTLRNLELSLPLLERLQSGRFVYVSSCHVYSPGIATKTEQSAAQPRGRYGLSKLLCESAVLAQPHLDVRVARPFNHIGSGMHPDLVVPSIVRRVLAASSGSAIAMQGLDSVRDFLDVEDIARAYLALLELDQPHQRIFNVSSGSELRISELVQQIGHSLGKHVSASFAELPNSSDDTQRLVGDPARLVEATGWHPSISLQDSIARLVSG